MNMWKWSICLFPKETFRLSLLGSIGFARGITTGAIYAFNLVLQNQWEFDQSFYMTSEQLTWIPTITMMSIIIGSLGSGIIIDKLGRRKSMILMDPISCLAWLLIYYCDSFTMLVMALVLSGLSKSVYCTSHSMYVGEVSPPQYRAIIASLPNLGFNVGCFLCQVIGHYVHWKTCGGIFIWFSVYGLLILLILKESYVTHLDQDEIELARECFEWFRGKHALSEDEFTEILNEWERTKAKTYLERLKLCTSSASLTPFYITLVVNLADKLSGVQAIMNCAIDILEQIDKSPMVIINRFWIVHAVRILATITGIVLVNKFSVRSMILNTSYLLSVSLLALGGFMYCIKTYPYTSFPYIALLTLLINIIMHSMGLGPFTLVVSGEMFPYVTRTIGIPVSSASLYAFALISTFSMSALIKYLGPYVTMTMFGFCTFFTIIVIHLTLPDTKNKTLLEIQRIYQ